MTTRHAAVENPPNTPSLRQFSIEFFAFFGATVQREDRRKNGTLCVELAGPLADHFGASSLQLCFDHCDDGAGYELVAHGSRMFDRMMAYLDARSAATLLALPRRHTSSEELMRAVRPLNASIADLQMRERFRHLYLFNWRITYRSDEKYEELYAVLLNDDGERVLQAGSPGAPDDAPVLESLFADGDGTEIRADNGDGSETAKMPPMTQLVRLAESARKYAIYHADLQCANHEAEILPRLYRTLNRITTYYGQQIEEVYDSHDRDGEKRRALELDLERKIAEEVENHRLRVAVDLFSYAVFQLPVAVADLTLSDGKRQAQIQVTRNRYSGAVERPRCYACGEEASLVALDRNAHVICDNCIEQCASCQEVVCAACGVEPCPVCGKENCADCGNTCWACGERACPDHIESCPVCGDTVCHACQTECNHCGVRQCRSHLLVDAVVGDSGEYDLICETCAVRCPGCRQFSAKVGTCDASGQQFCANCLVTCDKCGRRFGPGFYRTSEVDGRHYCMNCLQECPGCGALTPDIHLCEVCRKEYCVSCGLVCDICGDHCCDGQGTRYAGCDHVVCTEHQVRCSAGGEVICAVCSETCGICEESYCEAHSAWCRHCGQQYCRRCIGSLGLCETCDSILLGDGEPVDLSQEPCAVDPGVSEIIRHYSWTRAGNRRYVVYEGRNRLMGGAVVVVEATDGMAHVVHVQRLGLIEIIRDRLMRYGG
jgi:hypothetical protein